MKMRTTAKILISVVLLSMFGCGMTEEQAGRKITEAVSEQDIDKAIDLYTRFFEHRKTHSLKLLKLVFYSTIPEGIGGVDQQQVERLARKATSIAKPGSSLSRGEIDGIARGILEDEEQRRYALRIYSLGYPGDDCDTEFLRGHILAKHDDRYGEDYFKSEVALLTLVDIGTPGSIAIVSDLAKAYVERREYLDRYLVRSLIEQIADTRYPSYIGLLKMLLHADIERKLVWEALAAIGTPECKGILERCYQSKPNLDLAVYLHGLGSHMGARIIEKEIRAATRLGELPTGLLRDYRSPLSTRVLTDAVKTCYRDPHNEDIAIFVITTFGKHRDLSSLKKIRNLPHFSESSLAVRGSLATAIYVSGDTSMISTLRDFVHQESESICSGYYDALSLLLTPSVDSHSELLREIVGSRNEWVRGELAAQLRNQAPLDSTAISLLYALTRPHHGIENLSTTSAAHNGLAAIVQSWKYGSLLEKDSNLNLEWLLNSKVPGLRRAALRYLGVHYDPEYDSYLNGALRDEETTVRLSAIRAWITILTNQGRRATSSHS